jgi:hypothetical protein
LINLCRHSRDWCDLFSAGTRKQRGPILKQMESAAGDLPIAAITRKKIEEGISARTLRPTFQEYCKRLVQMGS